MRTRCTTRRCCASAIESCAELCGDGLDVILLKGAALAETVYGDIALRPMSDLDLLVRPRDVSAAVHGLARAGYHASVEMERYTGLALEHRNELVLYKASDARYHLDVHWSLFSPPYHHKVSADWFWATVLDAGGCGVAPARMLGPEAQVLYLAAHLMLHHGGRGLMWWQDVAEVIWTFRERLDWDVLFDRARDYDLVLPLQHVLLGLVEHWRLPIPAVVVEQLRALPASPQERQDYAELTGAQRILVRRMWVNLLSLPDWSGRLRYAMRNLFPPVAYMRWRYVPRRTWLLPLAYPYRWLRGLWPVKRPG